MLRWPPSLRKITLVENPLADGCRGPNNHLLSRPLRRPLAQPLPIPHMHGDVILETRGLVKEFKGFVAVDRVDLQVHRGRIHALIGPNGAGKTTCFNLLTKFLAPSAGQIFFEGVDITRERPATVARRGMI